MSIDQDKVKDVSERMKADLRSIIEKYSNEASELWVDSPDPHIPVIAFTQMALGNAGADYLNFCGATPAESFERVVSITGMAMEKWVKAVLKQQGIEIPATETKN